MHSAKHGELLDIPNSAPYHLFRRSKQKSIRNEAGVKLHRATPKQFNNVLGKGNEETSNPDPNTNGGF